MVLEARKKETNKKETIFHLFYLQLGVCSKDQLLGGYLQ